MRVGSDYRHRGDRQEGGSQRYMCSRFVLVKGLRPKIFTSFSGPHREWCAAWQQRQSCASGRRQSMVREEPEVGYRAAHAGTGGEAAKLFSLSRFFARNPGRNSPVRLSPVPRRCAAVAKSSTVVTTKSGWSSSISAATSPASEGATNRDRRSLRSNVDQKRRTVPARLQADKRGWPCGDLYREGSVQIVQIRIG